MKQYLMIFCWTNNDHQGFVQVGFFMKIQENEISTKLNTEDLNQCQTTV